MRFCYFALAAAATLLACTNAVSAENQLSQSTPELVTRTLADAPTNDAVKRTLRVHKGYDEEERGGGGYSVKALAKLATGHEHNLPDILAKMGKSAQKKIVRKWWRKSNDLKAAAKFLGMKSVTDKAHPNYPIFERFEVLAKKHTNH